MLQAVLFDLDGTLTNTDPLHFQVWRSLLQAQNLIIDEAFYQKHISGRLNPEIVWDLLPHLTEDQERQFSDHKEAQFRELARSQLQRMPGLTEFLAWIEQHSLRTAVVTNAPRDNTTFMLTGLGLDQTFETVVIAEDLGVAKPDPLPYQEALRRLNVPAEAAVAFEDSPSGLRSAVAAGITTIGVASTHPPERLYSLGAKLVIQDFTDEALQQLGF